MYDVLLSKLNKVKVLILVLKELSSLVGNLMLKILVLETVRSVVLLVESSETVA